MKKILAAVLAALILGGCTADPPAPTTPVTEPTEAPTEESVIHYDSAETLEFDYEEVFAAAPMGDDLLLFAGMDDTTLIKISGRNHKELATAAAGTGVYPGGPGVQIGENGVCFTTEAEYVFLDENLEETQRISLPDAWGRGVVTADLKHIYYSTGSQLRVYSRETGLDRLLRDTSYTTLESLELNDTVLVCSLLDHRAVPSTLFYAAATGELLGTYENSITLASAGDLWLAKTSDGSQNQIIFGGSGDTRVLTGWKTFSDVIPVSGGVLFRSLADAAEAIHFLNLSNNTETAVALDETALITNAWKTDGILWISLDDGRLCRWNLEDTAEDAASCIGPYYSRENPDTEGLAALETAAQELESAYGVKIHIAEDAVAVEPADGSLVSEYRVELLEAGLESLSAALSRFTPEFLAGVGKASEDGKIHISLVRSVSTESCFQFWDADGNARMALALGETLEQDFYHGLAHIIDARVMTKTTAFDGWKKLNPKGFDYDYDYAANANRDGSAYADAFIDTFAMSFPTEDRARVFEYAMLAGFEAHFQSETMQKKLSALCSGIRKGFKLSDADALPWEQYLNA